MLWPPAVDGLDRQSAAADDLAGRSRWSCSPASASSSSVAMYSRGPPGRDGERSRHYRVWSRAVDQRPDCWSSCSRSARLNAIPAPRTAPAGPRPERSRRCPVVSTRLIVAEAAVGAVLLIVAGLLADSAPSRETATPASPPRRRRPRRRRSSGPRPARLPTSSSRSPRPQTVPGLNAFTVTAASSRRPAPRPIDTVSLEVVGAKSTVSPPLQPDRCRSLFRRRAVGFGSGPRDAQRRHRAQR